MYQFWLCELAWYNWDIYFHGTDEYLDEQLYHEMYFGPTIDVRSVMIVKVIQYNGKEVYQWFYWPLITEEIEDIQG